MNETNKDLSEVVKIHNDVLLNPPYVPTDLKPLHKEIPLGFESNDYKFVTLKDSVKIEGFGNVPIDRTMIKKDFDLLLYLLKVSEETGSNEITTSLYKLVREGWNYKSVSTKKYPEVIKSLLVISHTKYIYSKFFQNGQWVYKEFTPIPILHIDSNHTVKIKFLEEFLEIMRNTSYFTLLDDSVRKELRQPLSARLYEILSAALGSINEITYNIETLIDKLGVSEDYLTRPSILLQQIEYAIKTINKKVTGFQYFVSAKKEINQNFRLAIKSVTFQKIPTEHLEQSIVEISQEAKELVLSFPTQYHNSVTATLIQGLLDKYGLDKVKEAYENVKHEEGFLPARIEQYLQEKYLTQKNKV
jgi:hypothetical protein